VIDFIILIPLGIGGWLGFKKGILGEIVDLLHFIVAFAISFKLIGFIIKIGQNYFRLNPALESQFVFILAIGITLILLYTVGQRFETNINYDVPGNWDNIVGAVFGVIKYAIAISFFFWFITPFGTMSAKLTDSAAVFPIVRTLAPRLVGGTSYQDLSKAIQEAM